MRWQMFISWALSAKRTLRLLHLAADLDVGRGRAVDHDVGDVVARQQRLERAVAEHVVADVLEQLLLLGNRHHHVLDLDDLADDVADLLARRRRLELGELGQIDGVDQRVEDGRLDVVVLFRMPALRRRPAPALAGLRAPRPAPAWRSAALVTARRAAAARRGQRARRGLTGSFVRLPNMGFSSSALELSFSRSGANWASGGGLLLLLLLLAVRQRQRQVAELLAPDLALAANSSIICPLLEARPKVSLSNSITCDRRDVERRPRTPWPRSPGASASWPC